MTAPPARNSPLGTAMTILTIAGLLVALLIPWLASRRAVSPPAAVPDSAAIDAPARPPAQ